MKALPNVEPDQPMTLGRCASYLFRLISSLAADVGKASAIVERELRVAARRPKTYRLRWIMAMVAFLSIGWAVWAFLQFRGAGLVGTQVFSYLGQLVFVVCLFAGMADTADCLSEEKREGTLGLLFLTDLKGCHIVIGKLLATSLHSIYGLLAAVPSFALLLFVGGVQGQQLFQLTLALLNALFFSLAGGLFISAMSRNQKKAANGAAFLMILFWLGPMALSEWLRTRAGSWEFTVLADSIALFSPGHTVDSVFGAGVSSRFWWSLLTTQGAAWTFLFLACRILPNAWKDKPVGPTGVPWKDRLQQWSYGKPAKRAALRRTLLNQNAFYWLASRERLRALSTWLLILGVLVAIAILWGCLIPRFEPLPAFTMTAITLNAVLKLEFAATAARSLAVERHAGTLELILSTPLSVRSILRGQWLALRRHYLAPVLVLVALDVSMSLALWLSDAATLSQMSDGTFTGLTYVVLTLAAMTMMLVVDLVALGWMGMWTGLNARLPSHAASPTVLTILVVPWVILLTTQTSIAILKTAWMTELKFWHFLLAWFGIGLAIDLFAILWSRRRLNREFRIVATQRFQPPKRGIFSEIFEAPWRLVEVARLVFSAKPKVEAR